MSPKMYGAFDWGYSYVKGIGDYDMFRLPSIISTGYELGFTMSKQIKVHTLDVETEGGRWFIGDLAKKQGEIFHHSIRQDRYDDGAFDALVKATLGHAFPEDGKAKIVTGLPPKFYATHKPLLENVLQKTHNFKLRGRERQIEVTHVRILPQLVGTGLDLLYDDYGKPIDTKLANMTVGIIDPGFGTTDIAVIENGEYKNNTIDSLRYNMHEVAEQTKNLLYNQHGIEIEDIMKVDDIVREGTVTIKGEQYDVAYITDWAKKTIAQAIVSQIKSKWLQAWSIDKIYLTGGGGQLLYPFIKEELNVELVKDPQYANVKGYLKMARREWA